MTRFKIFFIVLYLGFSVSGHVFAQDYTLVWEDQFEYDGLPASEKWGYDVGGNGWGNNELQYYTEKRSKNARCENGKLIIELHKENYEGNEYTSARLVTKNKGDWKYGKIEVRAKLPAGLGTWPAIWMLPTDWSYGGWPESGEIDIMEHVGYDEGVVHGTVHTEAYNHSIGTQKGGQITVETATSAFHTYTIEWDEDQIRWYVDGEQYFSFDNENKTSAEWPFDKRFHLILNIAFGGNWGGAQGIDENVLPVRMEVDYVKIYQLIDDISINGEEYVKPNEENIQFSVTEIENAQYLWSLPDGAELTSGQYSNEIKVNWGNSEGDVILDVTTSSGTSQLRSNVKLITVPGDEFYFDDFGQNRYGTWSSKITDGSINTLIEDNSLKINYTINNPDEWPYVKLLLDRPVDLSTVSGMQLALKTQNLSNSVIARIDLIDINNYETNKTPVFNILEINNSGNFQLYEHDFSNSWQSVSPEVSDVDKERIIGLKMFLNYGVYGKNNKSDSLWIDYIKMVQASYLPVSEIQENKTIVVYPNPATEIVYFNNLQYDAYVKIYNAQGQLQTMLKINRETNYLPVNNLTKGIYIIEILSANQISTQRIIKL